MDSANARYMSKITSDKEHLEEILDISGGYFNDIVIPRLDQLKSLKDQMWEDKDKMWVVDRNQWLDMIAEFQDKLLGTRLSLIDHTEAVKKVWREFGIDGSVPANLPTNSGDSGPSVPTNSGGSGPSVPTNSGGSGPSVPTDSGSSGPSGPSTSYKSLYSDDLTNLDLANTPSPPQAISLIP